MQKQFFSKFILGLVLFFNCSLAFAAPKAILTRIDATVDHYQTHVILYFKGDLKYQHFELATPPRLVLDIHQGKILKQFSQQLFAGTPILDLRSGAKDKKTLRLVFDLSENVLTQVATLSKSRDGITRVQVNFTDRGRNNSNSSISSNNKKSYRNTTAVTRTTTTQKPNAKQGKKSQPVTSLPVAVPDNTSANTPAIAPVMVDNNRATRARSVLIVIDPGHGGKDPGAHGPRGTKEKNVVLGISQKLAALLNREPGMKAVLTRSGDYYIGLRERLNIARKDKADFFIAIHADAYNNMQSHGASVFALSERGATSEAARWLAERENYSELGGVDLTDKNYMLRSVLIDLSQTATIGTSLQLGQLVLKQLGRITTLHNRRVEQARFVVLKSPDTPSLLIETGFISNPREEMNLNNPNYQQQLAYAIMGGINSYFQINPPSGAIFSTPVKKRFSFFHRRDR